MLQALLSDVKKIANPAKAKLLSRFFKTGPGQYGAGDEFAGIMVPQSRLIAKKYCGLSLSSVEQLLYSNVHEVRLIALLILVEQFNHGTRAEQKTIYNFYLKNAEQVNNWDLVDLTASRIVGAYLFGKDNAILKKLAKSKNLWRRRIAIIASLFNIQQKEFRVTLEIAKLLLADEHDLIHKAVGWMLREVGKKSLPDEEAFLQKYYKIMPRTMLRYAIERFPETKRQKYLAKQ